MPSATRLVLFLFLAAVGCKGDGGITSYNNEPEVTITFPADGEQVDAGVLLTLVGQADDPDDGTDELVATWTAGTRELCAEVEVGVNGSVYCAVALAEDDDEITLVVTDPDGASGTDHVSVTVVPTGSPQVTLSSPEAAGVYYSDKLIAFEGEVSDAEDQPSDLDVGLHSGTDGDLDLDIIVDSDGSVVAHGLLSQGEHAVQLWAEDTSGKRGSDSVVVQVGPPNTEPTCTLGAPESGEVAELGSLVLFEAQVNDPDIPEGQLTVSWSSDRDGLLGTSTPSSTGEVVFPWSGLTAATHVVTLEVEDEVGGTCTDFVVLTVGSPPSITLTSPAFGEIVDEGEELLFDAEVSDGEDDPTALVLSWVSDVDGEFSTRGPDSSGDVLFLVDDLSIGDHTVSATVTDTHDMTALATVDITVNGKPGAPVVSLSPDPADTTDALSVSIDSASEDPEDDAVTYAFAWYLDGVLSPSHTTASLPSSATARADVWRVEVTPNDGRADGEPGTATLTIGNATPSVSDVAIDPDPATIAETLGCSWSFDDPDFDLDRSTVAWTVGGAPAGTGITLSAGFARGDHVVCEVTPYDGIATGIASSASLTIGNSLPAVTDVTISPVPAGAGDELLCSWTFDDDDGDSDASTVRWTRGAVVLGTGDTLSAGAAVGGERVGCEVTPYDGIDTGTVQTAYLTLENTAPVVTEVSISPEDPTTDSVLTASVDVTDPDGDTLEATYTWYVAGAEVDGVTGHQLDGEDHFDKDQEVYVVAVVGDGTDEADPVPSEPVTVLNTPPTAPSVGLSPPSPGVDSDLVCAVLTESDDDDGDTVTYAVSWTLGGEAWEGATSTTTLTGDTIAATTTTAGQVWRCTITPSDDDAAEGPSGTSASVTVASGNTPPEITSLSFTTSTIRTDDTLHTSVSTYDADGDPVDVSYAWYVADALVEVPSTTASLDGTLWFDKGQEVYVVATPDDGTDTGAGETSVTLTVANTAPGAPIVSITPSNPREGLDSLRCEVDTPSPDADDDDVTYSMSWTVDGEDWTGTPSTTTWTDDTIAATATTAGEVWECTATPRDSEDGDTATASVTIRTEGCPIYADPAVTPGGDGSYDDPYPNIAYAMTYRGTCDEIVLKAGTYDEQVDFAGAAVTITSEDGPATTIIDPAIGGNVVVFDSGEGADSVLEGVTITGGTTQGIFISGSDPTIRGCVVDGNSGTNGGGVYATDYDGRFEGNTVRDNVATHGAGMYLNTGSAEIIGNWFEANDAATNGGGLWLNATALVANNVFLDNDGHGIYLAAAGSSNRDDSDIANNTIAGSTSYGIYLDYYYVSSSTRYYATSTVVNNIVYDSSSYDVYVLGGHASAFSDLTWVHNDVYGGSGYSAGDQTGLNGNISQDPDFADYGSGDLGLEWGSLAIDTGTDVYGHTSVDFDGEARTQGPGTDMGAYEYAGPTDDCDGVDDGPQCATSCPVYADPTVDPGGNGDYADPYPSIRYAMAYRGSCDELVLMAGTYDEQLDYDGQDLVIRSESGAASTVIDASVGGNVVVFDSGEGSGAVLEGVTITGGTSHGITINSSDPTILDCIVDGNTGTSGAGVYATDYDGVFDGNVVRNNAGTHGGGLYLKDGSAEITGNWFEGNSASTNGGGLWLNATALVANNVILGSSSQGIYLDAASSSSRDDSDIIANTIVDSTSYGIYLDYYYVSSSTRYYPTSFVANNIVYSSGSYDVYVLGGYSSAFSDLTWAHNDVYGGSGYSAADQTGLSGNISQDPRFTSAASEDFTLEWGSWAIDTGTDISTHGVSTDYEGDPRQMGPRYDMGAFEFDGPTDDCDGVDDGPQCATGCPVYVDPTVDPGGDGASDDPYPSIQYAKAYRKTCGELVLEPGTYDELVDYEGVDLEIRSSSGAASTVIDPAVGGNVVVFNSGEGSGAVLQGVTITGGTNHGVYINSSDPTILDCIVDGNTGTSGAGVYAYDYDGVFDGNVVSNNAGTHGGGLYLKTGSAEITGNWFEANSASTTGGGLWLNANALVANNVVLGNSGHGLYLDAASSTSRDDSDIIANTIVDTTSYGIYLDYYYVSSSTRYYPTSDVLNNLIVGSSSYDVYVLGGYTSAFSDLTWENNDVYGGSGYSTGDQTGIAGNISQDPNFVAAGSEDFSLGWPSNCIDAGQDVSGYGVVDDIEGTARPMGIGYDMGAYESW